MNSRRGLMLKTALVASSMLLLVAVAPSFPALAAASFLLGFTSSLPQMALPFALGHGRGLPSSSSCTGLSPTTE